MIPNATGASSASLEVGNPASAFRIALLALFMAGSAGSFRAAVAARLKADYLQAIDPLHATELVGSALAAAFGSFGVTLVIASAVLPVLGFARALRGAAVLLAAGLSLMGATGWVAQGRDLYRVLLLSATIQGVGWGLVETTANPLVSALFPYDRAHRLSVLHAWYPAGVVAGAIAGLATAQGDAWWVITGVLAAGALLFGILTLRASFPDLRGLPDQPAGTGAMLRSVARQPTLLLWMLVMMMTATTEFAPGQWVDVALSQIVGMRGILLLAYVSGLMFVMRHFAGPIVHRLSNVGLMVVSSALSAAGLLGLAHAHSPATALIAATVWGCGVCFLWPTMLATVSQRYPEGGAMVFGLLAASGAGTTYVTLPILGSIYDGAQLAAAGGADRLATATGDQLSAILRFAAERSFSAVAILPLVLVFVFAGLFIADRRRRPGGSAARDGAVRSTGGP